jgi:hypothetical protein
VREDYVLQESKQSLELHQKEEEKIHSLVREMDEYRDLPNFPYIVDTFIDEGRVERERLIRNLPSGAAIPFFHDKKRLNKHAMLTEINLLEKREKYFLMLYKHEVMKEKERLLAEQELQYGDDGVGAVPEGGRPEKVVEAYLLAVKEEAESQEKEVERRKNYYVASLKTKIVVLILYLALAAILSYFAMYGHTIMEIHRELLQR